MACCIQFVVKCPHCGANMFKSSMEGSFRGICIKCGKEFEVRREDNVTGINEFKRFDDEGKGNIKG